MRIRDLNDKVNAFFDYAEENDQLYNPEAVKFAEMNKEHYERGVGVTHVLPRQDEDTKFTNQPPDELTSAGYRGLQSLRKLSGLSYDKDVLPD